MSETLSLLGKSWEIKDPVEGVELSDSFGITRPLLKILCQRGVKTDNEISAFLKPSLKSLHDPLLLHDMDKAAERLLAAVRKKERILIYGDYDADGVTATALLARFLHELFGLRPDTYLPCRFQDGYGLSKGAIEKILAENKPDLIVTVDNGSTAFEEAEMLAREGVDLIVTDHHIALAELPKAVAVVNPKIGDTYPYRDISGAAVAFKLAWETARRFEQSKVLSEPFQKFLQDAVGLTAIGTTCDVMPLSGENRVLVHYGLKALSETRHPGLVALRDISRRNNGCVTCQDLYFGIGPRLNASGRVVHAKHSLRLLISNDSAEAQHLAGELEQFNRERRKIGEKLTQQACEYFANMNGIEKRRFLVFSSEKMHQGVSGLVAAKISERFGRPCMVFAINGDEAIGSGRSFGRFNIYGALEACAELFIRFGGHNFAGGGTIATARLPEFERRIEEFAHTRLEIEDMRPVLEADLVVGLDEISLDTVADIRRLSPFGKGNPAPVFVARKVEIRKDSIQIIKEGRHLAFYVTDGRSIARAVGFGMGDIGPTIKKHSGFVDIAFTPEEDTYSPPGGYMLKLSDIRLSPD